MYCQYTPKLKLMRTIKPNLLAVFFSYFIFNLSFATNLDSIARDTLVGPPPIDLPKFMPIKIDKPFLYAMKFGAYEHAATTGEFPFFKVPGSIDKDYLRYKSQIAVELINEDIYRGRLICVAKDGVYIYSNTDNALIFCPYETISWIRRGRSYGNWMWKSAIAYSAIWMYVFGEQNIYAQTQAIFSGVTTAITIGQLILAPIYSIRLNNNKIKTMIDFKLNNGLEYYLMVKNDQEHYGNAVDFETFPGFIGN